MGNHSQPELNPASRMPTVGSLAHRHARRAAGDGDVVLQTPSPATPLSPGAFRLQAADASSASVLKRGKAGSDTAADTADDDRTNRADTSADPSRSPSSGGVLALGVILLLVLVAVAVLAYFAITQFGTTIGSFATTVVNVAADIVSVADSALSRLGTILAGIIDFLTQFSSDIFNALSTAVNAITQFFVNIYNEITGIFRPFVDSISGLFNSVVTNILAYFNGTLTTLFNDIKDAFSSIFALL